MRTAQKLSLRTLGSRTGFSASFLSQIELDQVSPSLTSLDRIATALGVGLAALLTANDTSASVVVNKKGGPGVYSEWSRATARSLLPADLDNHASATHVVLEPGGHIGNAPRTNVLTTLSFCVRGEITLQVDGTRYALTEGDSAVVSGSRAALWQNEGAAAAEVILITLLGGEMGAVVEAALG